MSIPRWINHFCSLTVASHLLVLAILTLVAVICLCSSGCATAPVASIPKVPHPVYGPPVTLAPPVPASNSPADRRIADALAERDAAHAAAGEAIARAHVADDQLAAVREDKRIELAAQRAEAIAAWILWLSIACMLGVAAGCGLAAVAAIWGLGFGWKIPAGIAGGFAVALIAVRGTALVLDHPMATGLGFLALVALAIITALIHARRAAIVRTELARFGTDAASLVKEHLPDQWSTLRGNAMARQATAGVHRTIDALAARVKAA